MSVNINEIISDIKAEIKEKEYAADMLSFDDIAIPIMERGYSSSEGEYSGGEYNDIVNYLGSSHVVPLTMKLPGNPIIIFIKKIIRRITRVTIRPICEHQTEYNLQIARAFEIVGRYMNDNSIVSCFELSEKVKMLELKVQTASKEISALNARIAELKRTK